MAGGAGVCQQWWSIFDARPWHSGGFMWVGFDYRGEPNPYDHVSVSAQPGCVDTCGFPKDIYYYYKSWWGSEYLRENSPSLLISTID